MTSAVTHRSSERVPFFLALLLAALGMTGPFTIDTVYPAFERLGVEFGASAAALQQLTSVYLLAFAATSIFHGPLSDSRGRKPVMVGGMLGYAGASALCALAPNFGLLLAARALQGMLAGGGSIVSRAVVRDLYDGPAAQRTMATIMVLFAIAPAIAPIIGGWILAVGSWQLIFWFNAAYGLVLAAAVTFGINETLPEADRQPVRLGAMLAGLWMVGKDLRFERLAFASAFLFAANFIYIAGAPIIVVDLLGGGEQDFWQLFVPLIAGMSIGSWLSGRLADAVPRTRLVDTSVVAVVITTVIAAFVAMSGPTWPLAVVVPSLVGLCVSVSFPVLQLALLDLFPRHRGSAASLGTFAALLFNATLAGIIVPLVAGSLASVAWTAVGFAVVGAGLWTWHRSDASPVVGHE